MRTYHLLRTQVNISSRCIAINIFVTVKLLFVIEDFQNCKYQTVNGIKTIPYTQRKKQEHPRLKVSVEAKEQKPNN